MTYRQNLALALLGLTNADVLTIMRGFLRTIEHANKQLIERLS
jgi:hypothetical protein